MSYQKTLIPISNQYDDRLAPNSDEYNRIEFLKETIAYFVKPEGTSVSLTHKHDALFKEGVFSEVQKSQYEQNCSKILEVILGNGGDPGNMGDWTQHFEGTLFFSQKGRALKNKLSYGKTDVIPALMFLPQKTLDAAFLLTQLYGKIFTVLNMANAQYFGGGYTDPKCRAQEEDLALHTNFHFLLPENSTVKEHLRGTRMTAEYSEEWKTRLSGKGEIYISPNEKTLLCIRTPSNPNIDKRNFFAIDELRLAAKDLRVGGYNDGGPTMKERIRKMIEALIAQRKKYCILGAFGCGAFENNPNEVAELFKQVLLENNNYSKFACIAFAIYDSPTAPVKNYDIFKKSLSGLTMLNHVDWEKEIQPAILAPVDNKTAGIYIEAKEPSILDSRKYLPLLAQSQGNPLLLSIVQQFTENVAFARFKTYEKKYNQYLSLAKRNFERWTAEQSTPPAKGLSIIQGDSLDIARKLTRRCKATFAVLNMANPQFFGGENFLYNEPGGQEKSIMERTDTYFSCRIDLGQINVGTVTRPAPQQAQQQASATSTSSLDTATTTSNSTPIVVSSYQYQVGVYSDNFRNILTTQTGVYLDMAKPRICIKDKDYKLLPDDQIFSFYELRVASVKDRCEIPNDGGPDIKIRIARMLDKLIVEKVKHVVLGAFSCGKLGNEPKMVAKMFYDALTEENNRRLNHFECVAFAIRDEEICEIFANRFRFGKHIYGQFKIYTPHFCWFNDDLSSDITAISKQQNPTMVANIEFIKQVKNYKTTMLDTFKSKIEKIKEEVELKPNSQKILVINGDSLDVTRVLTKKYGAMFGVLVMANAVNFGGAAFSNREAAQEEVIFNRTDCPLSCRFDLEHISKRFNSFSYSETLKNVINTRDDVYLDINNPRWCFVDRNFNPMEHNDYFYFYELRVAAVHQHSVSDGGPDMKTRIVRMLDKLIVAGVRHVVLGAFGCGIFGNEPEVVSQLFYHALIENNNYRLNQFECVAFAILARDKGDKNLLEFQKTFKDLQNTELCSAITEKL